jgi:diguanylate cyclase (GGDEF)-like protein
MTAVTPVSVLRREQPARRGLPIEARNYLAALALAAAAATIAIGLQPEPVPWKHFVILLLVAPAVQLFAEHGPGNQVFHSGLAFTVAAVLLLPPELAVLVCIVQHLPEWARQRYPWYIQTFNIVNYVLSALAAALVWRLFGAGTTDTGAAAVAAAACCGAVFVVVNHTLLARMLRYARGRTLAETRLFSVDGLAGSGSLAAIGIVFAFTVDRDPLLAVLVALPLLLVQRALTVPLLRDEASRDHKTGLLNTRALERAAEQELERARRFGRPISVIVCDVDGLREVNNKHGHLAGDAALAAVADTLCDELRDYDLCGRFGGDEFVVVLPETALDEALEVAERIDRALAARSVATGRDSFPVALSTGVATLTPEHGFSLKALLADADATMYKAKAARATGLA